MSVARNSSPYKIPGVEYAFGGFAAVGAGCVTNPIDVIKIRLQLQGELEARGSYTKIYKNTAHAAYIIAKHEGVFALQAGIVPALIFQLILNGIRLGSFNTAKSYNLTQNESGNTSILKTAVITGVSGAVGGVVGSPFYMIKTQLQAQAAESIAVGHQRKLTGTWSALKDLWREAGLAGVYRGWNANVPRLVVGSASQLTSFSLTLDWLKSKNIFPNNPLLLTFLAAIVGGTCPALTMQPFDVLATRLYNQGVDANGKGLLYDGLLDALVKIFKTEGLFGLYKGLFPTWLRIAPHTVLCLVFYDELERLYNKVLA